MRPTGEVRPPVRLHGRPLVEQRPAVVAFGGGHGLSAVADGAAPGHRPPDRDRHGRRRRRFVGTAARASSTACRRVTCGWRWPRCAATTSPAAPGPTCCSTASSRPARSATTPSATCSSPGLWERLGDPVAGLDMVARLLGAPGRVLPMASVPLEIEADVIGLSTRAPRRDLLGPRARPRWPRRRARCARSACCPRTRRPARSRSRPWWRPTGSCSARGRGSPR